MTHNKAFERQERNIPLITRALGYHLENVTYVGYLETIARRLGVTIREDLVADVLQDEAGVTGLRMEQGAIETADLFVDCSGFRSLLLGKALTEPYISFASSLYCNRALIGGWHRRPNEAILPYTLAETMDAGWCWQIDHEHLINRGYVFSSDFLSDDQAEREFRAKNPQVEEIKFISFRSGRHTRAWVKNVVAIGNAAGFVEPLESTGLSVICADTQAIAESLVDCDCIPTPSLAAQFNNRNARNWDTVRDFLAVHYRFNTRLKTPFWQACLADVDLAGAAGIVDYYRELGPSVIWRSTLIDSIDQFRLDGYLTLLVGQAVPHNRPYDPPASEREIWRRIQAAYRRKGENGLTVEESLPIIRSPQWQWNQEFYLSQRTSNG
jgi:tryptophan halogenase